MFTRARSARRRLPGGGLLWALVLGLWTFVVVAAAGENYMAAAMRGDGISLWTAVRWPIAFWYPWALLTPVVFALARRFPLDGGRRWQNAGALLLAGAGVALLHVGLQVGAMYLPAFSHLHEDFADAATFHFSTSILTNLFTFCMIVGGWHALDYYRRYRQRELQAAHLESQLARAELATLKMQLHPHFLFNTLHAIATLMYRDVGAADRMLTRLSELLRASLDRAEAQEIPLAEEIEFVEKYLFIEQARFGERLRVEIDADPEVREALVPSFVLQPFVENAIKHAVAPRSGPGRIAVRAWAEGDALRLYVRDDGPGLAAASGGPGVGLANTRARLDHLYGTAYALDLRDAGPGLLVDLTLPLRWPAEAAEALPA